MGTFQHPPIRPRDFKVSRRQSLWETIGAYHICFCLDIFMQRACMFRQHEIQIRQQKYLIRTDPDQMRTYFGNNKKMFYLYRIANYLVIFSRN